MIASAKRPRSAGALFLLALIATAAPGPIAAEPLDYAYLLVQGTLSRRVDSAPISGATIRLRRDGDTLGTVTDERGVFRFDKLAVGDYDLELETADGEVMRGAWEMASLDASRARLRVRLGNGDAVRIGIKTEDQRVRLDVPEPEVRWRKLWVELGIFAVAALILGL